MFVFNICFLMVCIFHILMMKYFVQLIERAGRAADEEKVEQKMAESWEELSLVSASPKLIRKEIESVVLKQVAKATKQQKGICSTAETAAIKQKINTNVSKSYLFCLLLQPILFVSVYCLNQLIFASNLR